MSSIGVSSLDLSVEEGRYSSASVSLSTENSGDAYQNGQGKILTFDVSGYERRIIADESECLGGMWRNLVSALGCGRRVVGSPTD